MSLFGFSELEKEQLGAEQGADLIEHRAGQEDDALLEQPGIDVVGAFPAGGLLDHHRDERIVVDFEGRAFRHGPYAFLRAPAGPTGRRAMRLLT